MCDEASVVEMLSALPCQRMKGREYCKEKRKIEKERERESERESRRAGKGSATKRGKVKGELETRFASCRHLEAISYRFTRTPTKVSVHLHLESSLEIVRDVGRYCNACYEYRLELWVGFMTCTTGSHATERRKTLKLHGNLFDVDFHPPPVYRTNDSPARDLKPILAFCIPFVVS